jgi:hypothetical protein
LRSGRSRSREFWCPVVSEPVLLRLTRLTRLMQPGDYFVQCNQADCQYVEANAPPCPLHVGMFAEEIRSAAALREARREGY